MLSQLDCVGIALAGYVFSNLPGNAFNTVVRAFLSVELTFTFPIVMKPASDVMEEIVKNILMVRRRYRRRESLWVISDIANI